MKLFLSFFLLLLILPLSAFEWPQEGITAESFSSVFGQLRGDSYNNSLIFTEPAPVSAIESGTVLAILGNNSGEMGWMYSPLGKAVIISHDDNLISVYGNLKEIDISTSIPQVTKGKKIGTGGETGWQSGKSSMELQVIDTEKKVSINPRILMPPLEEELSISLYGITAIGRNGETMELRTRRSLSAGTYKLYRGREQAFFPHVTSVAVNGAEVEKITFDVLTRSGRRLTVAGRKPYNAEATYPTVDKQFLAEVTLSQGKNTVSVTVADINSREYTATYTLEVW